MYRIDFNCLLKKYYILFIGILFLIIALISLYPILFTEGWPKNHEGNSFFIRTQIYAQHYLQKDFFPIWSSNDNLGFGSPQPLFYHKLFYIISSIIYILTGSFKLSIALGIYFFLVIGMIGQYKLCCEAYCSNFLSMIAGIILPFTNYTLTDWLIRGAMAEFSAYMLIPWLFFLYLKALKTKNISFFLPIIIILMFFSHSTLTYFSFLVLTFVYFILCVFDIKNLKILNGKLFILIAFSFVLIMPYLYIVFVFNNDYNIDRFILPPWYKPENQINFIRLIKNNEWIWGKTWEGYTMQLDLPCLYIIFTLSVYILLCYFYKKIEVVSKIQKRKYVLLFCILVILQILYLNSYLSIYFYEYIPGAKYIQFPFRLLALLTPIEILFTILLIEISLENKKNILGFFLFIFFIFYCGNFSKIKYEYFTYKENYISNVFFSWFGEYVPKDFLYVDENNFIKSNFLIIKKIYSLSDFIYNNKKYTIIEDRQIKESSKRIFNITCKENCKVIFPLFYTPFHQVHINPYTKFKSIRNKEGMLECILPKGNFKVIITMPTIFSFFNSI